MGLRNLLLLVGVMGCASIPKPAVSLSDLRFSEPPHIVYNDGRYLLCYQRVPGEDAETMLQRPLLSTAQGDKAYYYFGRSISHFERGERVQRPVSTDGFEAYTRAHAIYWLNADRTEVRLPVEGDE